MKWYYYLHTNGDLIGKNPIVVDNDGSYFDSPFVKAHWLIDTEARDDGWKLLLEATALGADITHIKELATKWGATFEDSIEMLKHCEPTELMQQGLSCFIKQVLGLDEEEYWKRVESNWENATLKSGG